MTEARKTKRTRSARPVRKTRKRRRCENCNKLYSPSRDDQKFCRDNPDPDKCRKEFYRYGSSYGPLKTGLHQAIDKKCGDLLARLKKLESEIEPLLVERRRSDFENDAR